MQPHERSNVFVLLTQLHVVEWLRAWTLESNHLPGTLASSAAYSLCTQGQVNYVPQLSTCLFSVKQGGLTAPTCRVATVIK